MEIFAEYVLTYHFPNKLLLTCRVTMKYAKKTMEFANVMKYVTGSMISQEYTHQVSHASAPPWTESSANPAHRSPLVLASERASILAFIWEKKKWPLVQFTRRKETKVMHMCITLKRFDLWKNNSYKTCTLMNDHLFPSQYINHFFKL